MEREGEWALLYGGWEGGKGEGAEGGRQRTGSAAGNRRWAMLITCMALVLQLG